VLLLLLGSFYSRTCLLLLSERRCLMIWVSVNRVS
jgi:hypothetical protein